MAKSPQRRRFVIASVVALALLEVGLRLVPAAWWEAGLYKEDRYDVRLVRKLAADRPPPAADGDEGAWGLLGPAEFDYNRLGYRDAEWAEVGERPRIAFMGDSRVFGLYVDSNEVLSERFEEHTHGRWEALNFGVPGATSWAALDHVTDHALRFSPVAAVLLYDINSSVGTLVSAEAYSARDRVWTNVLHSSVVLRRGAVLVRHLFAGRDGRRPAVSIDEYRGHLVQIIRDLRAGDVREIVVLVGWTPMADVPGVFSRARYDEYRTVSREVGIAEGGIVLDIEELAAETPEERRVRGVGIHYSPEVLDRVALAVAQVLGPGLTADELRDEVRSGFDDALRRLDGPRVDGGRP